MERVRIRSLLNNFKYNQKSLSARKGTQTQTTSKSVTPQQMAEIKHQVNSVNHSCFLMEPLTNDQPENKNANTIQVSKNFHLTPKDGGKRRTKIANKSYMLTLIPRQKNGLENLKQLGIRTKKISQRSTRSTQKFLKMDLDYFKRIEQIPSQMITLLKIKPQFHNQKLKTQTKKTTVDTFREKYERKNDKPLTVLLPWNKNKIKMFSFNGYPQIKTKPYAKGPRKDSDICPWDLQSPS